MTPSDQRLPEAVNRWGDPPQGYRRPLSALAVAAGAVSLAALVGGPLQLVWAALGGPDSRIGVLSVLTMAGSFLAFPAGLILSYVALIVCRLDSPHGGRGLAWLGLGFSYVSLAIWQAALTGLASSASQWFFYAILLLAGLHLLVLAAESTAGRVVLGVLVVAGIALALISLSLVHSRESARKQQARDNLRKLGTELHRQWELRHEQQQTEDRGGP